MVCRSHCSGFIAVKALGLKDCENIAEQVESGKITAKSAAFGTGVGAAHGAIDGDIGHSAAHGAVTGY
jgi:hypothetical protein